MNHKPFVTTELKPITQQFENLQDNIDLEKLNADLIDYRDQIARLREAVETLTKQRDELSYRYQTASRLADSSLEALSKALKERDALKDAARLALDALDAVEIDEKHYLTKCSKAITALKAVL